MSNHNSATTNLSGLMKSHHCAELTSENIGQEVTLCGWNNKYRDLGGLHFVDIRDKHGLTQLAFDKFDGDMGILKGLSLESVIMAKGIVRGRPDSAKNKNMATGEVEVAVKELTKLSHAEEVPFLPHGKVSAGEDLKLKYRYLDLRSDKLQNLLSIRSEAMKQTRMALYSEGFTEIETPILYKTTPEGARDYVVPSRVHPGKVYALPQSPQTLKQLLMIGNTDKYFQICKCFRDEDLRSDRQPEFSQIDIEVSFSSQEYIKNLTTKVVKYIFGFDESFEIETMSYSDAMRIYGSDKPDARFGLEHSIVTNLFKGSGFSVFESIIESGMNKMIFVPKSVKEFSRKEIDALLEIVKPHGGKGVAWFKLNGDAVTGGISKFVNEELLGQLKSVGSVTQDGIFFFCADGKASRVHACADALRRHFGHTLGLITPGEHKFLWINDFPLLDYDDEDGRFYACHHPFTMPKLENMKAFMEGRKSDLMTMTAEAYDMVCNGYEMGGGSLRIYQSNVQEQMFRVLGMEEREVNEKFGFFVEALKYGTPPHAGFAFGLDRTVMLLAGTDNIRDVIAFPKTNAATDLMSNAPSTAEKNQLDDLQMRFDVKK